MRAIRRHQPLRSRLRDHRVQIVHNPESGRMHHLQRDGVVTLHVLLAPVEVRAAARVPLVDDRRGVRKNERGLGLALQADHELPEVRLIVREFHLMSMSYPLQVVQPAVEMHDVGLFADDPFLEVLEHIRTVAAVFRRAEEVRFALEQLRDAGRITQADGIADEDEPLGRAGGGVVWAAGSADTARPKRRRSVGNNFMRKLLGGCPEALR